MEGDYGITKEAAGLMGSGAFAAGAYHYLTPAKSIGRALGASALIIAGSWLFGEGVADATGLVLNVAGALAGLSCLGLAAAVIVASQKADFNSWFDRGKVRQAEQKLRAAEFLETERELARMAAIVDQKLEGDAT